MKRLFKKHGQLLSVIGAITVFLTFIAKEGIAEHWKETVAAVDQADYRFRSLGLSIELLRRVDGVVNSVERIEDAKHGFNPHIRTGEERITATASEQSLAIAEELLVKLRRPNDPELSNLRSVRAKVANFSEAISDVAKRLGTDPDPVMLASEMMPLTMRGMHVEQAVAEVVKAARQTALESKESSERNLSVARWVSYLLYALGWAIALAGKVYGRGGEASAE